MSLNKKNSKDNISNYELSNSKLNKRIRNESKGLMETYETKISNEFHKNKYKCPESKNESKNLLSKINSMKHFFKEFKDNPVYYPISNELLNIENKELIKSNSNLSYEKANIALSDSAALTIHSNSDQKISVSSNRKSVSTQEKTMKSSELSSISKNWSDKKLEYNPNEIESLAKSTDFIANTNPSNELNYTDIEHLRLRFQEDDFKINLANQLEHAPTLAMKYSGNSTLHSNEPILKKSRSEISVKTKDLFKNCRLTAMTSPQIKNTAKSTTINRKPIYNIIQKNSNKIIKDSNSTDKNTSFNKSREVNDLSKYKVYKPINSKYSSINYSNNKTEVSKEISQFLNDEEAAGLTNTDGDAFKTISKTSSLQKINPNSIKSKVENQFSSQKYSNQKVKVTSNPNIDKDSIKMKDSNGNGNELNEYNPISNGRYKLKTNASQDSLSMKYKDSNSNFAFKSSQENSINKSNLNLSYQSSYHSKNSSLNNSYSQADYQNSNNYFHSDYTKKVIRSNWEFQSPNEEYLRDKLENTHTISNKRPRSSEKIHNGYYLEDTQGNDTIKPTIQDDIRVYKNYNMETDNLVSDNEIDNLVSDNEIDQSMIIEQLETNKQLNDLINTSDTNDQDLDNKSDEFNLFSQSKYSGNSNDENIPSQKIKESYNLMREKQKKKIEENEKDFPVKKGFPRTNLLTKNNMHKSNNQKTKLITEFKDKNKTDNDQSKQKSNELLVNNSNSLMNLNNQDKNLSNVDYETPRLANEINDNSKNELTFGKEQLDEINKIKEDCHQESLSNLIEHDSTSLTNLNSQILFQTHQRSELRINSPTSDMERLIPDSEDEMQYELLKLHQSYEQYNKMYSEHKSSKDPLSVFNPLNKDRTELFNDSEMQISGPSMDFSHEGSNSFVTMKSNNNVSTIPEVDESQEYSKYDRSRNHTRTRSRADNKALNLNHTKSNSIKLNMTINSEDVKNIDTHIELQNSQYRTEESEIHNESSILNQKSDVSTIQNDSVNLSITSGKSKLNINDKININFSKYFEGKKNISYTKEHERYLKVMLDIHGINQFSTYDDFYEFYQKNYIDFDFGMYLDIYIQNIKSYWFQKNKHTYNSFISAFKSNQKKLDKLIKNKIKYYDDEYDNYFIIDVSVNKLKETVNKQIIIEFNNDEQFQITNPNLYSELKSMYSINYGYKSFQNEVDIHYNPIKSVTIKQKEGKNLKATNRRTMKAERSSKEYAETGVRLDKVIEDTMAMQRSSSKMVKANPKLNPSWNESLILQQNDDDLEWDSEWWESMQKIDVKRQSLSKASLVVRSKSLINLDSTLVDNSFKSGSIIK